MARGQTEHNYQDKVEPGHVLIIDDEVPLSRALERVLSSFGHEVSHADHGRRGLALVKTGRIDLVLLDNRMPGMTGLEVLNEIKAFDPHISVIMMTGFAKVESAVQAIKEGAIEYMVKPFEDIFHFCGEVVSAGILKTRKNRSEAGPEEVQDKAADRVGRFDEMVGNSAAMRRLFDCIAGVAQSEVTVLVESADSTQRHQVAVAVHRQSRRSDGPFLHVDCASEASVLFGSGAFSEDVLESSRGGTVFLDNLEEISAENHDWLFRSLSQGRLAGNGAGDEVGARLVVGATGATSGEAASHRQTLTERTALVTLNVPALDARREDIPLLAQDILRRFVERSGGPLLGFEASALEVLSARSWPGDVVELRQTLERCFATSTGPWVQVDDLEPSNPQLGVRSLDTEALTMLDFNQAKQQVLESFETLYLSSVLERTGHNISRAAREAGMDRSNFRRLLKKLQRH